MAAGPSTNKNELQNDTLSTDVDKMKISEDPRVLLRSWLGRYFRIVITDKRLIVGRFVCTDKDANVLLDNALEYSDVIEDNSEPRGLGLALIPGRHIKLIELENY